MVLKKLSKMFKDIINKLFEKNSVGVKKIVTNEVAQVYSYLVCYYFLPQIANPPLCRTLEWISESTSCRTPLS